MSQFVNSFIKDHREYFARNKKIIEENRWNDIEEYNNRIASFSEQLLSVQNSKDKDKAKKLKEIESNIKDFLSTTAKNKKSLFEQENKLTNSILGRLSAFISEASGDRNLTQTQEFIDETVKIIQIHLKKCNTYLKYSSDALSKEASTEEEINYNDSEIVFQDDVFNKKISIQNTLSNLNLENSTDNLKIKFFKDQKASLLMKEPVCINNMDIRMATNNLNVTWDVFSSTEMLKNMKPSDIPVWNNKKHYFEQNSIVLSFWASELHKITRGLTINGYFIHPWLYWHLNLFKTPIPQADGTEPTINPYLRDNELFFCQNLHRAEEAGDKGMLLYGTRRFTKSVILASYVQWKAYTKFNSVATVTGGSEGDLTDLTSKIRTSMLYMPPALKLETIKQEWDGGDTLLGLKEDASTPLVHSIIKVKNLSAGAKTATQKTAGGAPSAFVNDEIGKYAFLKSYLAAIPSFETPFGFKTVPLLAGTAGEADMSADAMTVLSQPEKYSLLAMDWDMLRDWVDPEYISWKPSKFSLFLPAQMAYKKGFVKIEKPLGDFLKLENPEELNKNSIQITDWKGNLEKILAWRKEAEGDTLLLQQRTVQYPISPEEVWLSSEINIFPYEDAKRHRDELIESGKWDRRRDLWRDEKGRIHSEISTKPLVEFPFSGGNQDAPFLIFEDIPDFVPPQYMYLASGDFYKQESSDTDSVGTVYIFKYDLFADKFSKKLVASYSGRPNKHTEFYEKVMLLLEAYNASFFPENEDMGGFQTFIEKKHLEDKYLVKHIDFNSSLEYSQNGHRKYGWTPAQSKRKLLNMFANYCNEPVIVKDDAGNDRETKRVYTIDDIWLLTELMNFTKTGNFDRISGCLGAIGFQHFLEKNYIYPKGMGRKYEQEETPKVVKPRERSFYNKPTKGTNFYSRRR